MVPQNYLKEMSEHPISASITSGELATEGRPFRPLNNLILVDKFDDSRCGWYGHHIDREGFDLSWGPVMRSTMPTHSFGSHGAQSGLYSLKLATQPEAGKVTRAIKRMTMPYHEGDWYTTMRLEAFFTYHEEPRGTTTHSEVRPEREDLTGESNVRGFLFAFDLHDKDHRWWPGIRYANYDGEKRRATWQYNDDGGIDPLMEDYTDLPDGQQDLCWNSPNDSVPWKPNWHYLRFDIDMAGRSYVEFQCNDCVYDMSDLCHEPSDPYHEGDDRTSPWPDIDGLLNPIMSVQTNTDTRSFLFVDSLVLSAEVKE